MGDKTGIEWTDATWNPIAGCSIKSPGCKGCYAMKMARRLELMGQAKYAGLTKVVNGHPVWTGEVREHAEALDQPLRWKKPRRIFVNSMSDLFHEDLPDHAIDRVFAVMALAPQHTFQVLTKRVDRMRAYLGRHDVGLRWVQAAVDLKLISGHHHITPEIAVDWSRRGLPHVLLGASVEDQKRADERCDDLMGVSRLGWATWVSYEPAIGPVDWSGYEFIRWLVSGGESGDGDVRVWHPAWFLAAGAFCSAHGIPFLHKQNGEWGATAYRISSDTPVVKAFATFQQWVDKAPGWLFEGDVCVDTAGNLLKIGADFMAARDAGRFPVAILRRIGKRASGRYLDGKIYDAYPILRPTVIGVDLASGSDRHVEALMHGDKVIAIKERPTDG